MGFTDKKENLDFPWDFCTMTVCASKKIRAQSLGEDSNTIDIYDAVFDTLVASLEHTFFNSVAKHLIEFLYPNCSLILPAEYIARFAKLVP